MFVDNGDTQAINVAAAGDSMCVFGGYGLYGSLKTRSHKTLFNKPPFPDSRRSLVKRAKYPQGY
jgi:hypothetical protein